MQENIFYNTEPADGNSAGPEKNNSAFWIFNNCLKEKIYIKKAALASGISFILVLLIYYFWGNLALFLGEILGYSQEETIAFIISPPAMMTAQVVISIFCFTIPFILVFKLFRFRISDLISFKRTEKGLAIPFFFFGVAFCAFANILNSKLSQFFESIGSESAPAALPKAEGFFMTLLTIIATCLTPALVEEFAFRGIILGAFKKYGDGFAIFVSSAAFGLIHGNFQQIPFAFMMGLFLGFCTVRTGSIRIAMCVHFYNNFFSFAFDELTSQLSSEQAIVCLVIYFLLTLVFGIIALNACRKKEIFKLDGGISESTLSKKLLWFFTSTPIIIFCVYSLKDIFFLFEKG